MIKVSPEQLITQLRSGLRERYLWGTSRYCSRNRDAIRHAAQEQGFDEHFTFSLEQHTDWDAIFLSAGHSVCLPDGRHSPCICRKTAPMPQWANSFSGWPGSYIRICC